MSPLSPLCSFPAPNGAFSSNSAAADPIQQPKGGVGHPTVSSYASGSDPTPWFSDDALLPQNNGMAKVIGQASVQVQITVPQVSDTSAPDVASNAQKPPAITAKRDDLLALDNTTDVKQRFATMERDIIKKWLPLIRKPELAETTGAMLLRALDPPQMMVETWNRLAIPNLSWTQLKGLVIQSPTSTLFWLDCVDAMIYYCPDPKELSEAWRQIFPRLKKLLNDATTQSVRRRVADFVRTREILCNSSGKMAVEDTELRGERSSFTREEIRVLQEVLAQGQALPQYLDVELVLWVYRNILGDLEAVLMGLKPLARRASSGNKTIANLYMNLSQTAIHKWVINNATPCPSTAMLDDLAVCATMPLHSDRVVNEKRVDFSVYVIRILIRWHQPGRAARYLDEVSTLFGNRCVIDSLVDKGVKTDHPLMMSVWLTCVCSVVQQSKTPALYATFTDAVMNLALSCLQETSQAAARSRLRRLNEQQALQLWTELVKCIMLLEALLPLVPGSKLEQRIVQYIIDSKKDAWLAEYFSDYRRSKSEMTERYSTLSKKYLPGLRPILRLYVASTPHAARATERAWEVLQQCGLHKGTPLERQSERLAAASGESLRLLEDLYPYVLPGANVSEHLLALNDPCTTNHFDPVSALIKRIEHNLNSMQEFTAILQEYYDLVDVIRAEKELVRARLQAALTRAFFAEPQRLQARIFVVNMPHQEDEFVRKAALVLPDLLRVFVYAGGLDVGTVFDFASALADALKAGGVEEAYDEPVCRKLLQAVQNNIALCFKNDPEDRSEVIKRLVAVAKTKTWARPLVRALRGQVKNQVKTTEAYDQLSGSKLVGIQRSESENKKELPVIQEETLEDLRTALRVPHIPLT